MAKLENNARGSGFLIENQCPEGTFPAVILCIEDEFGVSQPKFENPREKEIIDLTRMLFGVMIEDTPYLVQTFPFRISGNPKSNLMKFLTELLGRTPQMGWDYCELQGTGAIIKVEHKQSSDGTKTYANIVRVRPIKDDLSDHSAQVPKLELFNWGDKEPQVNDQQPPPPAAPIAPAPGSAAVNWSPDTEGNVPF